MLDRGSPAVLSAAARMFSLIVLCLVLTGCAGVLTQRRECTPESLLKEASRLASLPPENLEGEFLGAKDLFTRTGSVCDRFQVALVSFSSPSRSDDAYGARMMEDYLASSSRGGALSGLAAILLRTFEERIYQDARLKAAGAEAVEEKDRAAALAVSLSADVAAARAGAEAARAGAEAARRQVAEEKSRADALRRQVGEEQARTEGLRRQLADEQARAETLRRQLDGLREIDKILMQRDRR